MNTSGDDIEMRERRRKFKERLAFFIYLVSVGFIYLFIYFTTKKDARNPSVGTMLINIAIRI